MDNQVKNLFSWLQIGGRPCVLQWIQALKNCSFVVVLDTLLSVQSTFTKNECVSMEVKIFTIGKTISFYVMEINYREESNMQKYVRGSKPRSES